MLQANFFILWVLIPNILRGSLKDFYTNCDCIFTRIYVLSYKIIYLPKFKIPLNGIPIYIVPLMAIIGLLAMVPRPNGQSVEALQQKYARSGLSYQRGCFGIFVCLVLSPHHFCGILVYSLP